MKHKFFHFLFSVTALLMCAAGARAQNVGIGTNNPQSRLHVNGDICLKNGVGVNTISADSMFTNPSDTALPTQKAMKRFLQKGLWAPQGAAGRRIKKQHPVPGFFQYQFRPAPVSFCAG